MHREIKPNSFNFHYPCLDARGQGKVWPPEDPTRAVLVVGHQAVITDKATGESFTKDYNLEITVDLSGVLATIAEHIDGAHGQPIAVPMLEARIAEAAKARDAEAAEVAEAAVAVEVKR